MNAGKADGFFAANIIDIINHNVDGDRVDIGRIDLMSYYSLFDVREGSAKRVIKAIKGGDFFGKRLFAEIAVEGKNYADMSEKSDKSAQKARRKKKEEKQDRDFEKPGKKADRKANKKAEKPMEFQFEKKAKKELKRAEKPKKSDNFSAKKSKYHGNFDIFIKKK